jgi:hypothetical protein
MNNFISVVVFRWGIRNQPFPRNCSGLFENYGSRARLSVSRGAGMPFVKKCDHDGVNAITNASFDYIRVGKRIEVDLGV